MTSVLKLDYVIPSNSTEIFIEIMLLFEINKEDDYISCFNALTKGNNPQLIIVSNSDTKTVYLYLGDLEDCNTVLGAIHDIKKLQNNIKPKSMFTIEARLLRLINTLILFCH